jgi:hypothetical protein
MAKFLIQNSPEIRIRHFLMRRFMVPTPAAKSCLCATLVFSVRFERRNIRRELLDLLIKTPHLTPELIHVDA